MQLSRSPIPLPLHRTCKHLLRLSAKINNDQQRLLPPGSWSFIWLDGPFPSSLSESPGRSSLDCHWTINHKNQWKQIVKVNLLKKKTPLVIPFDFLFGGGGGEEWAFSLRMNQSLKPCTFPSSITLFIFPPSFPLILISFLPVTTYDFLVHGGYSMVYGGLRDYVMLGIKPRPRSFWSPRLLLWHPWLSGIRI